MKKRFLFLMIFFFCALFSNVAFAQKTDTIYQYKDVLFLKNGTWLYGQLLDYVPDKQLSWGFSKDEVQIFPMSAVLRVQQAIGATREERKLFKSVDSAAKASKVKPPSVYAFSERGWYHITAASANLGSGSTGVGLSWTSGWLFRRTFGVGVVGSLDDYYLVGTGFRSRVFSLGGEIRGYIKPYNNSAYYTCAVGVGFPIGEERVSRLENRAGGLLFYPAFGWRLGGSAKANFLMDVGFRFQTIGLRETFSAVSYTDYDVSYKRWVVRFGIVF
jgi:hypothetical protein